MRLLEVDSNEVKNISPENIEEILKSDVKNKREKVEDYFKKKYGRLVDDSVSYLTDLALEQRTLDHPVFKYVDRLKARNSTNDLYIDYLALLGNELDKKNITPGEEWLYDQSLYNENIAKNVYKIKAMLFLKNKRNILNYGLYQTDNDGEFTNKPLTVEDIRGKSEAEVRSFLDSHQSTAPKDDYSSNTLKDWFKYHKINNLAGVVNYVRDSLKGNKSTDATAYRRALDELLKSNKGEEKLKDILRLPLTDDSPEAVKKVFLKELKDWAVFIKRQLRKSPSTRRRSREDGARIVAAQPFEDSDTTRV